MTRPGADLIAHYLDPDRLPVGERWSRKHAHTQRRLCERFAAPVIDAVTCQDITAGHTQKIVNAASTAGEGDRVHRMISALVSVGLDGGYLANPRLAKVHWQAGDRQLPAPRVSVAGESGLWVDPDEIPADGDIGKLGRALAGGRHGERDELMASTAAYSGGIGERLVEMSFGLVRTCQDAAGAGDELLEPGRSRSAQMTERPIEDISPFQPPIGADRGRGHIGHAQVGEDVVDRRAVIAEQLAELGEGQQVAAVGKGGDPPGPPGPGNQKPGFCEVGVGERPVSTPAGRGGVGAHGQHSGRDQIGGRGDEFHVVGLGQVGGFGGRLQGIVPASQVDIGPPQRGQARAAGVLLAGSPEPLHASS